MVEGARFALAPPRYRNAEQEGNEQTCQRRFARDGADRGERLPWLSRGLDSVAQPIDCGSERRRDFGHCARDIGCGVDRSFRDAGLKRRFRLDVHSYFSLSDEEHACLNGGYGLTWKCVREDFVPQREGVNGGFAADWRGTFAGAVV